MEVDLIFLIAVPEKNENNLHLRFLSEISKKLMDSSFRERLRNADNEHEVFVMLHEINEKVMEETHENYRNNSMPNRDCTYIYGTGVSGKGMQKKRL